MTSAGGNAAARLACPLTIALALLAGCGGGSHHHHAGTNASKKPLTAARKPARARPTLRERLARLPHLSFTARGAGASGFSAHAQGITGKTVVLQVVAPGRATTPAQPIDLTIPAGPRTAITATASSDYHTQRVKISSANSSPITLGRLQYTCLLPPSATICPPQTATYSHGEYHLKFLAFHTVPVELVAIVNPPRPPSVAARHAANKKVAPYSLVQQVETITPPAKGAPKGTKSTVGLPSTKVAAAPKQSVVIVTQLIGHPVGRNQIVTVTISRQTGRTLTMSAKVEGGKTVRSTITSADGKPIRVISPYYSCFLGTDRSVCPKLIVRVLPKRVAIVYTASPYTPPLVLLGTVAPAAPKRRSGGARAP